MFKSPFTPSYSSLIKPALLTTAISLGIMGSLVNKAIAQNIASQPKLVALSSNESQLSQMAKEIHQQVNRYREGLGLAPLNFSPLISEQALIHSVNMAEQKVEFSHKGFDQRIDALKGQIDYSSAAENVAYNMGYQDPVTTAVQGWIESDGHRRNLEGNYNLTGIGVAVNQAGEYYFTQIFVLEN